MAEDTGGLNYQIDAFGNFDSVLKKFIDRVNELDARVSSLKGNIASASGASGGGGSRSVGAVNNQAKQDLKYQNESLVIQRKLEALERRKQILRSRQVSASQSELDVLARTEKLNRQSLNQAVTASEAQSIAAQKNLASQNALAVKRAQITQIMQAQNVTERKAAELVGVTSAQAKQMGLNMWDAEHAARQFLFTFRRLVGILAIFTAARELAGAIAAGVREMSRFNAELESAGISIATIITSVGQVVDSEGNLVTGAEAFSAALQVSTGVVSDLKKQALGSIATFQALVQAYQVAVGPGLAAGLDVGQIEEVSKALTEGAIRLGVPLNQLSEEIRSLLQGTATARNTRIAVLFGGAREANEAIRLAKEQGNLYEVLMDKLKGVSAGADAASTSMEVLKSNLQDSVQLLLAEGGIEQFVQLKEAVEGLTNALRETDAEGNFIFNPVALGIVQEVASTLSGVSRTFREITDTGQALALLRNVLATIGDVLKAIAPAATAVFQGIVTGVNLVLTPLRLIVDSIRAIAGKPLQSINKGFVQLVKYAVAIAAALLTWKAILAAGAALKGLGFIFDIYKGIGKYLAFINALQAGATAQTFLTTLATHGWAAALALVNVQAALIGGVFTIIAGVLVFVAVKFGLVEKLAGAFTRSVSEAGKNAQELEYGILGASDAAAEGAKSAQQWADALRDARFELEKAKALEGLKGQISTYAGLIVNANIEIQKGTEQWRSQIGVQDEALAKLREELKLLKQKQKEVEATTEKGLVLDKKAPFISVGGGFAPALKDPRVEATSKTKETEVQIASITKAREENLKKIAEYEKNVTEQLNLQIAAEKFRGDNPLFKRKEQQLKDEADSQQRISDILNERANVSVREVASLQAKRAILQATIDLNQKERDKALSEAIRLRDAVQIPISPSMPGGVDPVAMATYTELNAQVTKLKEDGARTSEEEAAAVAANTRELEKQKALLAGDFTAGLKAGLEDFTRELPALGFQIADIVSGALSDLAGVVASTFKDAIDPRKDADLRTAFGEFFLSLAGSFVEAITQQLISSAITELGFGVQPVPDPAVQSNTVSTDLNTTALNALNTTLQTQAAAPTTPGTATPTPAIPVAGAGGADSGTAAAPAAAVAQQGIGGFFAGLLTNPLLWAIFIPIIIGLLSKGFAKGGKVKGYASGGNVDTMPRPSTIPASDTVPAWLTPNEFVMQVSAVKKYGLAFMNAINSGVLNPASFGSTIAPALHTQRQGIRAFAAGGSVAGSGGLGRVPAQKILVYPAIAANDRTMDQLASGGRGSFKNNVNKVEYIGDPNRSSAW